MEKKNEIFGVFMIFQESRYRFSFALSLSLSSVTCCGAAPSWQRRSAIQFAPTVTREIDDRYERREKKKKNWKEKRGRRKKSIGLCGLDDRRPRIRFCAGTEATCIAVSLTSIDSCRTKETERGMAIRPGEEQQDLPSAVKMAAAYYSSPPNTVSLFLSLSLSLSLSSSHPFPST